MTVSAVPNRWDPSLMCKPLTTEQIEKIVQGIINAAVISKQAGVDGICIGGAYGGYMTDQFYTKWINQRDDKYRYGSNTLMEEIINGMQVRRWIYLISWLKQINSLRHK